MTKMTRQQANARLLDDVQADLIDSSAVFALLERQFDAAVRHRSAELAALAAELSPLLDAIDARRRQRLALVRALLGPQATMDQYFASLAPAARGAIASAWGELERIVRACKEATSRNGALLAEQYSVMQRVLHGEEQIYEPR
ncbi:flagellar export chaperone FlgN [Massilia niastensis]|uniref:flagellar export chaperone FlgN n=1 Tax=Massilia niastensis TaxID=544911 RepID=UPI000365D60F|nr:flagellar export chaperone FlgN [Massilia niastensis]